MPIIGTGRDELGKRGVKFVFRVKMKDVRQKVQEAAAKHRVRVDVREIAEVLREPRRNRKLASAVLLGSPQWRIALSRTSVYSFLSIPSYARIARKLYCAGSRPNLTEFNISERSKPILKLAMSRAWRVIRRSLRFAAYGFGLYLLVVAVVVWLSGDDEFAGELHDHVVNDITELNPVPMARIVAPRTTADVVRAIRATSGRIAIGGGRYSMGGQTASDYGLQIDMRDFDEVVAFSPERAEITVQAGMTWRELQDVIDPHELSVKIMQTYANFTVGGSVSVNVHGRYIGHGPIISSVKRIELVLADGSVVAASPEANSELYYAAVGGYGGIGVITEVTLELARNDRVERRTRTMPIEEYREHFMSSVRNDDDVVFHNADMYPPDFEQARDVTWYVTDAELTEDDRLIPPNDDYFLMPKLVSFSNGSGFGKWARRTVIDPLYYLPDRVVRRNWEASYDVRELGSRDRSKKTWVLQEYFIPVERFDSFVPKMRAVFQKHDVDVVNVSIRHALPDPGSYLAWARREVFAFVVYHSQGTTAADQAAVRDWTREMIDAILSEQGTYYLPYQPHATRDQFMAAYPQADRYFAVKREVDPEFRFSNKLLAKYYPDETVEVRAYLDGLEGYQKGEEQTLLTLPEWYLVFNPFEYASFLESGNSPSDFPFLQSIDEYWSLYDRVNVLADGLYPANFEYQTMLWVIGVSTTAEFVAKGAYENTIGRLTRWIAGEDTEEDVLIREAHRAYSDLIYTKPWYEFPFADYQNRIWSDTSFFGPGFARKLERKLMFSLEFGFKALYAKAIGFGAQTAFEGSDGLVTMYVVAEAIDLAAVDPRIAVLESFDNGHRVVTVPRWGEFTEIVPKMVSAGVRFVEISGNDEMLVTALAGKENDSQPKAARLLFQSMVIDPADRRRSAYWVKVEELHTALKSFEHHGLELEHLFDY